MRNKQVLEATIADLRRRLEQAAQRFNNLERMRQNSAHPRLEHVERLNNQIHFERSQRLRLGEENTRLIRQAADLRSELAVEVAKPGNSLLRVTLSRHPTMKDIEVRAYVTRITPGGAAIEAATEYGWVAMKEYALIPPLATIGARKGTSYVHTEVR